MIVTEAYNNGIIDKDIFEVLRVTQPRTPSFYSLPKTHKNSLKPPGPPIISGIGAKSEKGSRLVDAFLRHVVLLPFHLHNTMALLRTLHNKKIPVDSLLVSIDVEALYCSIPNSLGLSVVESFLSESDAMAGRYNAFIIQILQHILTRNVECNRCNNI